jgi:hypothetical protein
MLKIKQIGSELSTWFKQVFRIENSWILLPGLVAVIAVYGVHLFKLYPWLTSRDFNESFAPWLVLLIFAVLLVRTFMSRDPLMLFLTVLALVFFVRELNSTVISVFGAEYLFKSKKLVDCLLVLMGLWAFGWHEKIFDSLNRSKRLKIVLAGVAWTYLFSQLIARRAFRGILPEERLLHIPLEETVETAAHMFFLGCAVFCFFFVSSRKAAQAQTACSSVKPVCTVLPAQHSGSCEQ